MRVARLTVVALLTLLAIAPALASPPAIVTGQPHMEDTGISADNANFTTAYVQTLSSYGDISLTQNGVTVFNSKSAGAVANTLRLSTGFVGIGPGGDPDVPFLIQVTINVVPFATGAVIEPKLTETDGSGYGANGLLIRPEFTSAALAGAAQKGIWVQNIISHTEAQTVQELDGIRIDGNAFAKTGTNGITQANGLYVVAPTIGATNYAMLIGGESVFQGDIGDSGHKVPNIWVTTNHVGDVVFNNNWRLNESYAGTPWHGVHLIDENNTTQYAFDDTGLTLPSQAASTACDATHRGEQQYVAGTAGQADELQVCMKSSADTYAWHAIASG